MNSDMIKELITQLDDPDYKVRRAASKELRTIIDPDIKSALFLKIGDSDEIVRRNAVIGLSNWDEKEIADAIIPLLKDDSFDVRCGVIPALCKISCQADRIIPELRMYLFHLPASYIANGQEKKESQVCYYHLSKIDPDLDKWQREYLPIYREQNYMNRIETVKQRIDHANILEKEAITSLSDVTNEDSSRITAATNLGKVYFDRYILPFILRSPNSLNYKPGRSGSLFLQIDYDFDSWFQIADLYSNRFKAKGAKDILNRLLDSALNDSDEGVRSHCVLVLQALKDEQSLPKLKKISKKYSQETDYEGRLAGSLISDIVGASRWERHTLRQFTSKAFEELALEIKWKVFNT